MNEKMKQAALLAVALIVSLPLGLAAQDDGYYPYSYARLSYVSGAVYIERTSGLGYEKGEVNFALVQGDRIGTEAGQAEIQFGRRNYLRLDNNTKVEFALLPQEGEDRIKLHLTGGSAYLRVSHLALEKGVELHTPDASFYVLDTGLYRFDVRPGGETRAYALEGSLEAAAEDGSVMVRDGESVTAAEGRLLDDPGFGSAPGDAFGDWNGERDAQLAQRSERQYLPSGIDEYEEELDQNGQWVYERPYGNVWVPYAAQYDDWRPYSHGRWLWYPVIGWTWVSSEAWGWPVYHYGRWNWRFGLGWYWIPRHHWGPAWVHWWSDGLHVGWCPLTWYNRPAYLFHDRFYDRYDDRWFSAHNRAMTVVRRDHLQSPDVGRRHLASNELDRIGRVELRDRQPEIRPAVDNARPQAVAARRALADPAGARSRVREVEPSRALASSRTRPGATARTAERVQPSSSGDRGREALAKPSVRNDGPEAGSVRTFPSRRDPAERRESGVTEYRRGDAAPAAGGRSGERANDSRVTRSQDRNTGESRPATVREPQRSGSAERGGSTVRREGAVKSDPPARSGATVKSSSGRSQSRTYASSRSISRPSARVTSPYSSSSSRSSRLSAPSSSRAASASVSRPRSSGPSAAPSSGSSGRTFAAPRSSGSSSSRRVSPSRTGGSSSSGRSMAAPRTSRPSSSGRSYSAPRSSGSSSGASVRSGGSAPSSRSGSSGRSSSSGSRSSGSSSRSGSAQRKK